MRHFAALVAVALIGTSPSEAQRARNQTPLMQRPDVEAAVAVLDAWITSTVTQRELPGLSIGIVYDQDLVWAKGYGLADLQTRVPASSRTLYRIASITKLFTATAIMQLRDAGKLRLDDPITERIPWLAVETTTQGGPPITIKHLVTHTSGLPRDLPGVNFSEATFPGRDALLRMQLVRPVRPPETAWVYSNLAMALAGEVVSQVSGESWGQFIERHILQPLGMSATRTEPTRDLAELATGYSRRVPGRPRDIEPFVTVGATAPAGVLASNVEDLAKFVSLQLRTSDGRDAPVLQGSTIREMHRVQWLADDWRGGQGLGFRVDRVGDHVRIGHGGDLPGNATQVTIEPALKLGVIVLTNANDGHAANFVDHAFALVGPAIIRAMTVTEQSAIAPAEWQAYVGSYTTPGCASCAYKFEEIQIRILNGQLTMITPDADDPWSSRLVLQPRAARTFTITSPGFSYAAIGETVTFDVDAAGRVIRVRMPAGTWVPKR